MPVPQSDLGGDMSTRAERRRAEREAKRKPQQEIHLQNPVSDFFGTFIFGNSLQVPGLEAMCDQGQGAGKSVLICGAGPTLNDHIAAHAKSHDELWACNSALPWLISQGYRVTHGITVDQTPAMLNEWETVPDVEYLLASTVHPFLTEYLIEKHHRRVRWFHSYVGIRKPPVEYCECGHDHDLTDVTKCVAACGCAEYRPRRVSYEDWLYLTLYPPTVRVGAGLNTATRAIDLALTMGYERVTVLGADCALRISEPAPAGARPGSPEHKAWLETVTMHADGGNALRSGATATTVGGEIDGRWWETKPDMMISAVFLAKMAQAAPNKLRLIGDTLPNALLSAKRLRKKDLGCTRCACSALEPRADRRCICGHAAEAHEPVYIDVNGIDDVAGWMPTMADSTGRPLIPTIDPRTVALWRGEL